MTSKPATSQDSPFAEPQFRWLYASNVLFFLAMGSQGVLRAWLVFDMTQSEFSLGLISFVVAVPMLLVAPLGGVIADRFDRRNLIRSGQTLIVLSELVVLLLLLAGKLQFWHLLALAAVSGSMFPFIMPARNAIVANVVGIKRLPSAMALNTAGINATRVLGPAMAGFLIGAIGIEVTYALGFVLYVLGLACLLPLTPSAPPEGTRDKSIVRNIGDGFRFVLNERIILMLLVFGLVPMFLAMPFQSLLVVFAEEVWNTGAAGLGLLSAAAGLGGIGGSALVAWRPNPKRRALSMLWSAVAFGGFLLLFSLSPWFLLALPLVFVANVFVSVFGTLNNTAIQVLIPDHVRGRVSAILMMSFSLPLLGTLPMGALAEVSGAPFAVALAAALAVVAALALFGTSHELRKLDTRMHRAFEE
ncbi:MAG: MFS transporter [Deltaproteobacteria bacterium]|nr:MFS transporter [Deltaproteobacteria bacterium]MBW2360723.1 MFS transporter [Deltaproteobacteria bacterium]